MTGSGPEAGYGHNMTSSGGAPQMGTMAGGLPPVNHHSSTNDHHGLGALRAAGKVEHVIGTLVGSSALKTRGLENEQYVENSVVSVEGGG
jgi:hypothetical protein